MPTLKIRQIQWSLAIVWLGTGVLSLGIYPQQESLALLARIGIVDTFAWIALYFGATLDITVGFMTVFMPSKILWQTQAFIIFIYTLVISVWLPEFWLHPFGPILKNIPMFTLLWLLYQHKKGVS